MQIEHNISLKVYNTFGIDVKAKHFVSVSSIKELKEILALNQYPDKLILGGGSNILLTKDLNLLVIHLSLKGITKTSENENTVLVKAHAGENWHEFVQWCIRHNFGGLENLSLIPGHVGTAPIQNIGAYGVELKDIFVSCEGISIATNEMRSFYIDDCNFGYRNSIFKQDAKGQYIITSVTFKLTKKNHILRTDYGDIKSLLKESGIERPSIKDVSDTVVAIRESKLPNPKIIGNSGSFFKNPVISKNAYNVLKTCFPDIPSYPISKDEVKIPAGWLIERAGFKGKRFGNYGIHDKQALVLVNYGGASGEDILNLSKLIQKTIYRLFNIFIEAEVNIL